MRRNVHAKKNFCKVLVYAIFLLSLDKEIDGKILQIITNILVSFDQHVTYITEKRNKGIA